MNSTQRNRQASSSEWMRLALIVLVAASSAGAHEKDKPAPAAKNAAPSAHNPSAHSSGKSQGNNTPGGHHVEERHGTPTAKTVRPETELHPRPEGRVHETRSHEPEARHDRDGRRPEHRVLAENHPVNRYTQRPYSFRGHEFVQRTYYAHGVAYNRVYRPYFYRGVTFHVYAPLRFYSPGFYAWAYTPWVTPVYYRWGWSGSPWFGFYSDYFAPYPYYRSPTLWLTDYMIASALQEAYQDRLAASAVAQADYQNTSAGAVALTPQVKQAIADEVQRQLAQERAEGQNAAQNNIADFSGPPPILADNRPHVFVVSDRLTVNAGDRQCVIAQGDVLRLNPAPAPDPAFAQVQVLAAKGEDCRTGSIVSVRLADLQEMQNHMRETLEEGLGQLKDSQGQGGLPAISPALLSQAPAPYASNLPPADPAAVQRLK